MTRSEAILMLVEKTTLLPWDNWFIYIWANQTLVRNSLTDQDKRCYFGKSCFGNLKQFYLLSLISIILNLQPSFQCITNLSLQLLDINIQHFLALHEYAFLDSKHNTKTWQQLWSQLLISQTLITLVDVVSLLLAGIHQRSPDFACKLLGLGIAMLVQCLQQQSSDICAVVNNNNSGQKIAFECC